MKKIHYVAGFTGGGVRINPTVTALRNFGVSYWAADITRGVRQHQDERLVVHLLQDVLHSPARGARDVPDKTEGAMGTFKLGP